MDSARFQVGGLVHNPYVDADEYSAVISMSSERVASVKERAARAFPEAVRLRYAQLLRDWAARNVGADAGAL